jgi:hypothetical protein
MRSLLDVLARGGVSEHALRPFDVVNLAHSWQGNRTTSRHHGGDDLPGRNDAGAYWIPLVVTELREADALLLLGRRVVSWQELEQREAPRRNRTVGANSLGHAS